MGRPTKENSLTRKDVIEAAIACLDQEGESALGVNRIARELGIKPPAIYKHVDGNTGLRKAVVIAIWQRFFTYYKQQTAGLSEPRTLLQAGGHATRNFARSHPALYRIMMQVQLQPTDAEAAPIIQEALGFFRIGLESYNLTENQLIDVMRIVNAAVSGFIAVEQAGLLTLNRSTDASFEVMLDALFVAIEHIRAS
ncbi:MAG: WHG domain-containing protein [Pelatocladus maniniholoensis HA4357-MV3]|jgi:AcrR family transcriptional regulator|uniref:WHG domain-containing protein n=1 Tax=Pelatocladus maniniholoensis HA4357-MV3 TaxID=1117104 RepID=A0A9E3H9G0_9NOST|nr:WHG domain-containing protein [Pelatocladus maniniholoensis HA4357-MV3]BAZ65333.1 transcriptional regulator [Fischerella sp. NIES-4106]